MWYNVKLNMKEIDQKLKQWIPVNTIIRAEVRQVIVDHIEKEVNKAYERGLEAGLDYKLNTNTNG